jgi:hypothetical protein
MIKVGIGLGIETDHAWAAVEWYREACRGSESVKESEEGRSERDSVETNFNLVDILLPIAAALFVRV